MNLQRQYLEQQGWPVPDGKTAGKFHINCYKCGDPLTLDVDTSCGVPSEVGTECLNCGAEPVYRVNWWYEFELQEMKRDAASEVED